MFCMRKKLFVRNKRSVRTCAAEGVEDAAALRGLRGDAERDDGEEQGEHGAGHDETFGAAAETKLKVYCLSGLQSLFYTELKIYILTNVSKCFWTANWKCLAETYKY